MRTVIAALALAAALAAQQPNTVTASVSLTRPVPAATSVFVIQLAEANLASSVDTALAPLTTLGMTSANLSSVSVDISQGFIITTYNFRLAVPSTEFTATRDKLITVSRNLANSSTQGVGWSSSQTPTDADIAAALESTLPDLLDKAKTRAAVLAQAMTSTLGKVVNLSTPAVSATGPMVTFTLSATYAVAPIE